MPGCTSCFCTVPESPCVAAASAPSAHGSPARHHSCWPGIPAGYALHPDVGLYFTALQPDGAAYGPAPWLARSYPDDWASAEQGMHSC